MASSKISAQEYREMQELPAFQAVMEFLQSYKAAHLRAEPPSKILPNYSEVTAANAAQYRVVSDLERMLEKRSLTNE